MIAESQDEYPVDFDDAWGWIGYSSKQMAEKALESNFVEDIDFLISGLKSSNGGRPSKHIRLTVDCFKQFCLMAGTPRGKQVRLHYLEIERKFKAAQAALATSSSHNALSTAPCASSPPCPP